MNQKPMTEFACDLSALAPVERKRHGEVFEEMTAHLQDVVDLPDGYAFRFPPQPSLLLLLAEFVSRERLCCPFLNFTMEVSAGGGPFVLAIAGPPGAKELLYAELNLSTMV